MKKKNSARKNKKLSLKLLRLDSLRGYDICSCVPWTHGRCDGPCRRNHLDEQGHVHCPEAYKIVDTDEYKDLRRQMNKRIEQRSVEVSDKDKRRFRIRNRQKESGSNEEVNYFNNNGCRTFDKPGND